MKCNSCGINVAREFKAAIKKNKCPACSKRILNTTQMPQYLALCDLLRLNFKDLDVEKVALTVIGSFKLRQIETSDQNILANDVSTNPNVEPAVITVAEAKPLTKEEQDKKDDQEYKTKQIAEAKKVSDELKRMREEAYQEAEAAHWGMDIGEELASSGTNIGQAMLDQKKEESRNRVLNGNGGFRRQ